MSHEARAESNLSAMVCLGVFVSALDMSIVNVALPAIAHGFGVPMSRAGWVASAYAFALAGTVVFFGHLSDRVGRLAVFRAGLATFLLSSAACAVAPRLEVLVVARCAQGAGAAMLQATANALVTGLARPVRHGALVSNVGMAIGLGMLAGPSLGGGLLSVARWEWIFWVNVPVCLLALWAGRAWIEGGRRGTCSWLRYSPGQLFEQGRGGAAMTNLATAVAFGCCTGVTLLLPPALLAAHAAPPAWQVGLMAFGVPAGVLISTKFAGAWVRETGEVRLMGAGAAVMLAALMALSQAQGTWGPARFFPLLLLYGIGGGLFQTPSILHLLGRMPAALHGLAGALQRMAQSLGVAMGGTWASWMLQRFGDGARAGLPRLAWGGAGTALGLTSVGLLLLANRGRRAAQAS